VVQRMEILSLTFVLMALMAYVHGRSRQIDGQPRGWAWIALCLPLVALGLLGKETAILFPVFALALELTVLNFGAHHARSAAIMKGAFAAGIVLAVAVFALVVVPHYLSSSGYDIRGFSMGQRLLTQLTVLPMYIGQILLPLPGWMPFYYDDYPAATSLVAPISTLFGAIGLGVLFGSAVTLRRRAPLYSLGIFWFFGAHLLTSNVIPLELAFEHRNYFALLGIVLAMTDLLRRIPVRDGPVIKYAGAVAIILGFVALTAIRSGTWGEPFLLATDLVDRNPQSPRASNDLATIYMEMSDNLASSPFYQFGQREFERGSLLPNASILPEQGLILMAASTGDTVKDEWWDRLIGKLRNDPITPEIPVALFNMLGNRERGVAIDDDRLAEALSIVLSRTRQPHYNYARVADYMIDNGHDPELADRYVMRALELSRPYPGYAAQLVTSLIERGKLRSARAAIAHGESIGLFGADQFAVPAEAPDDVRQPGSAEPSLDPGVLPEPREPSGP